MTATVTVPRPTLRLLDDADVRKIIDDAWQVLARAGVRMQSNETMDRLRERGFKTDPATQRAFFDRKTAEPIVQSAPKTFRVFGRDDDEGLVIGEDRTVFNPGSAVLEWLDPDAYQHRRATFRDCVRIAKVTDQLEHFALQSTAAVPSDVPEERADPVRLYAALRNCAKPIVTGASAAGSFPGMLAMLRAVAGTPDRPLAIFDCCPTPPLSWGALALSTLTQCARAAVPAEIVSMPMAGATAPVTLQGTVVQHTAETLSGIIVHQMTAPGAPVVWGGSGAIFDMVNEAPPVSAMESMMIQLACVRVGRTLGLPTHAYLGCSDAKVPDYQAGAEAATGVLLAVLLRVNVVSGPGMLACQNVQSLEKLVLDHDACAAAFRLARGFSDHDDTRHDPVDIICAHAEDAGFLTDRLTRRLHRKIQHPAGRCVDRRSIEDWTGKGSRSARKNAAAEVRNLLDGPGSPLDPERTSALHEIEPFLKTLQEG